MSGNLIKGVRRQGRSAALQLLYQAEANPASWPDGAGRFFKSGDMGPRVRDMAMRLVTETQAHLAEIDQLLEPALENWKLTRLSVLVRQLLRLAVCEMVFMAETPPPVVMDEAVELARDFIDEEAARLVNGVLDAVAKKSHASP